MHDRYTQAYFASISGASRSSAAVVAPLVMKLLKPNSVIDVGCGVGAWLAEFKRLGVADVAGVDGPYIRPQDLVIAPEEFISADLRLPLNVDRQFDLAVSLEVAEHLPETSADQFVATLTQLAPAVLFSAAIPYQGGEDHVNEQWPSYWADRFATHGFQAVDALRRSVWNEPRVQWWYAQNILCFATGANLDRLKERSHADMETNEVVPLVHPGNYTHLAWRNRVLHAGVDIASVVPSGARMVLADDDQFGRVYLPNRDVRPFLERDGEFAGPAEDDAAALDEFGRQVALGTRYFAFGWPSFWQLEQYTKLAHLLRTEHRMVCENERVVVFELQT